MKQRFTFLLLALVLFTAQSWGQTSWNLSPTMTATLDSGVLTVSTTASSEAMPDYNATLTPWNAVNNSIFSVVIEDKVTSIGVLAFSGLYNLTSATISGSVTSIGNSAFQDCPNFTSISIPDSVTTIGGGAFANCQSLTSITIPNSVTAIGDLAFVFCSSLTSITVNSENPAYSSTDGVLYNKDKTRLCSYPNGKNGTFTIPNSVTTIGNNAFAGSSALTSLTIPNSVISINYAAFQDCTGLTSITIPVSVVSIWGLAFLRCSGLTDVIVEWATPLSVPSNIFEEVNISAATLHVPAGTKALYQVDSVWGQFGTIDEGTMNLWNLTPTMTATLINGVLTVSTTANAEAMPDLYSNTWYPWFAERDNITSIVIEDQVTHIGDGAFTDCKNLTSVTIPNSVITIGINAFVYCGFTSITIPNSVTTIGDYAFLGCTKLISIAIPNSVTTIRDNAFLGCTELTSIVIPNSVTYIGGSAFAGCDKITTISIPSSVTFIGTFNKAFTSITVDAGNTAYLSEADVLYNKDKTMLHTYPSGKSETTFTIPGTVTTIGDEAFIFATNLNSITIPNSVTTIGGMAFLSIGLKDVSVSWTTPLSVSWFIFCYPSPSCIASATLHVPAGTKALYQADPVWGTFGTIVEEADNTSPTEDDEEEPQEDEDEEDDGDPGVEDGTPSLIEVIEESQVDEDGTGSIVLSLTIPASTLFTGSFQLSLPSGVSVNISATRLVGELASQLTLTIIQHADGSWLFSISPDMSLRSGSDMVYGDIIEIVYSVDETVVQGTYEATVSNLSFAFHNGTTVAQNQLPVVINVNSTTDIAVIAAESAAWISNGRLYVASPVAETVGVYSITGVQLYNFQKPAGEAIYPVDNLYRSILIIRGSSGWVRKTINN